MATAAECLAELHRLLLALREVEEQLARGPRQIKAREQVAAQARTDLETRRNELKTLRVAADRKSLDLKTNEARIADLKAKLNAAQSNREYEIIRGQVAADTAAHGVLEDEALELMEKVDRTQSTIGECEEKLRRADEEARRFTSEFESVAGGLRERVAALSAQVRQAESGLTGDVAEKYRRLVDAYGAGALASVESGVCSNCQMQVTPQYKVLLNSGKVMFCGSCGRLMYIPPNAQ
jgi:predicted  nucleic acid-binding Zn-ribbon protein